MHACHMCHRHHAQGACPFAPPPAAKQPGALHPGACCSECASKIDRGVMKYGEVCDPCNPRAKSLEYVTPPELDYGRLQRFVATSIEGGESDPDKITYAFLREVYPVTSSGVAVPWTALPAKAHPCLGSFKRMVKAQVRAMLSGFEADDAASQYLLYTATGVAQ